MILKCNNIVSNNVVTNVDEADGEKNKGRSYIVRAAVHFTLTNYCASFIAIGRSSCLSICFTPRRLGCEMQQASKRAFLGAKDIRSAYRQ